MKLSDIIQKIQYKIDCIGDVEVNKISLTKNNNFETITDDIDIIDIQYNTIKFYTLPF